MSYFRIDLKELSEAIDLYKSNYTFLLEEIDSVYGSLNEVDAGWIDENSKEFKEILKKDKYNTRIYFSEISKLYRNIEMFKERLLRVSQKYSNGQSVRIFKYNDEKVDSCISKIMKADDSIKNSINYIRQCNFSDNYNAITSARRIINNLTRIRNYLNQSVRTLSTLKREMNNIVNSCQTAMERQKDLNLDLKKMEYKWQVFEPEMVDIKNKE